MMCDREKPITNCMGDEFKVGDEVCGLYGFGEFITGPISIKDGQAGVQKDDMFYTLDDHFEGGFDRVDK